MRCREQHGSSHLASATTKDVIGFNFDLNAIAPNEQFGFIASSGIANRKAAGFEARAGVAQLARDRIEGLLTVQEVVDDDKVEVDRESWEIANEQVDRRATLKGKGVAGEDIRRDVDHHSRGL